MKSYNGFSPEQREAGDVLIKEAIADGRLKPLGECACAICGQTKGILHYHCEDYSPDKVVADARPVCWRCHMMIHTRFRHPLSFGKYMIETTLYGKQYAPVFVGNKWEELEQHYID